MIPAMVQEARVLNGLVARYEGLVYTTARQIVKGGVELDLDEVRQRLRIKVLYAIGKYDSDRSDLPMDRYVFGAITSLRFDIERRLVRRNNGSVDAIRDHETLFGDSGETLADWFDGRYLSQSAEETYFEVEDEAPAFLDRLTCDEKRIVSLHAEGFTLAEVEDALGLSRGQARVAVQSAREKLADWRPSAAAPRSAPLRPLPGAAQRTARPRLARAA